MKAEHIIIEKGKIFVTGEKKPNKPSGLSYELVGDYNLACDKYEQALQSWRDRAVEVGNPEYLNGLTIANWSELRDGVYQAPLNLVVTIKTEAVSTGNVFEFKWKPIASAIVSFQEPTPK